MINDASRPILQVTMLMLSPTTHPHISSDNVCYLGHLLLRRWLFLLSMKDLVTKTSTFLSELYYAWNFNPKHFLCGSQTKEENKSESMHSRTILEVGCNLLKQQCLQNCKHGLREVCKKWKQITFRGTQRRWEIAM